MTRCLFSGSSHDHVRPRLPRILIAEAVLHKVFLVLAQPAGLQNLLQNHLAQIALRLGRGGQRARQPLPVSPESCWFRPISSLTCSLERRAVLALLHVHLFHLLLKALDLFRQRRQQLRQVGLVLLGEALASFLPECRWRVLLNWLESSTSRLGQQRQVFRRPAAPAAATVAQTAAPVA